MQLDVYTLAKAGFQSEEIDKMLHCTDVHEQIKMLRKCRCERLEEIHSMQQILDQIDYMLNEMKTDKSKEEKP